MSVLVTGGTGYIGAHVVRALQQRGDEVVVIDDLVTGNAERVPGAAVIQLELAGDDAVDAVASAIREYRVDAVIHLAARKQVAESMERPAWYYQQNVGSLANVLMAMELGGVTRLVFSSSAAVYAPATGRVTENDPTAPVNPYGETKLVGEMLVASAARAPGLSAASLRYFNVAGAGAPELGDTTALNLVPMVFERLDRGQPPLIFGDDYETPDGTCVRDYVHVLDVAEAHLATLDALGKLGGGHHVFNVGTGTGASVLDVVTAALQVAKSGFSPLVAERRPGDAVSVIAAADRIRDRVGWRAQLGVSDIIESAWASHEFFAGR